MTPEIKEVSPLPDPETVGKTLFSMFGEIKDGSPLPETTQDLIGQYKIYESGGLGNPNFQFERLTKDGKFMAKWEKYDPIDASKTTASQSSPDSPAISPNNIDQAEQLVTCTNVHYWYGIGPQIEAGFTDKGEGFAWPKKSPPRKEPFQKLADLEGIRPLLEEKSKGETALISFWKKEYGRYELQANLTTYNMSLAELLQEVGSKQK